MGHYASEMSAPIRHEPEVLIQRRAVAREGATFRWDLYRQYEDQGEWIDEREKLTCPRCFALVPAVLRTDHDRWHDEAVS